jgi:hypothetical protein
MVTVGATITTLFKTSILIGHWWLTPVILGTQEAEIRRIVI